MFRLLIACIAAALLTGPAVAAETEDIVVAPGSQLPYSLRAPIRRVAVGDPKVAAVSLTSPRSLLITGKQAGTTTLFVWENRADPAPSFQARLLVTPMTADDGLKVEDGGGRLRLAGTLSSLEAHQSALVTLRGGAAADGKAAGVAGAATADVSRTVDASASSFDTQVQIDIKVVEVSRRRLMDAGFFLGKNTATSTKAISGPGNLSGVVSDPTTGNFTLLSTSSFLPFVNSYNLVWGGAQKGLLGALSLLEGDGFAYTLAEPSLTAISGQTASFLAGGEIPIPMRTGGGSDSSISILFKEFGVRLALTPTVLDRERIFLKVAPEVSELDDSLAVQSGGVAVPGLRVRRTETSVALSNGESFVLSGLISRSTASNVDKFPFLGDIPILGAFFRSTRFDRSDKELLMVVTAHLVRPFAKEAPLPPLPGEAYRAYEPSFSHLWFEERGRFSTGFSD